MSSNNETKDFLEEVSSDTISDVAEVVDEVPKNKPKTKKRKTPVTPVNPEVPTRKASGFKKTTVQVMTGRPMSALSKDIPVSKSNKNSKINPPAKGFDFI